MYEIAVILFCVIALIILKIALNVNFKEIKKIKFGKSKELEEISKKIPDDKTICEDILKRMNKKNIKIKQETDYTSCLYTVFNNTITIGAFKEEYMKPQTISHECIHASQNKRTLWFNFIFTNIYLIYFAFISILTLFNKLLYTNVHIIVLFVLGVIQYVIRFSLENEAMIKARYIAMEYIEKNKLLSIKEKDQLFSEYDKINEIGIPFTNYYLISMNFVKVIIYSMICLI